MVVRAIEQQTLRFRGGRPIAPDVAAPNPPSTVSTAESTVPAPAYGSLAGTTTPSDIGIDWSQALAGVLSDLAQPVLAAQPVVDLANGTVAGYELLSRFETPPEAPPDVWFSHADRLGLATALTARVIERAFILRTDLPSELFLTINVEPHLLTDPAVLHALHVTASLEGIVVELT